MFFLHRFNTDRYPSPSIFLILKSWKGLCCLVFHLLKVQPIYAASCHEIILPALRRWALKVTFPRFWPVILPSVVFHNHSSAILWGMRFYRTHLIPPARCPLISAAADGMTTPFLSRLSREMSLLLICLTVAPVVHPWINLCRISQGLFVLMTWQSNSETHGRAICKSCNSNILFCACNRETGGKD